MSSTRREWQFTPSPPPTHETAGSRFRTYSPAKGSSQQYDDRRVSQEQSPSSSLPSPSPVASSSGGPSYAGDQHSAQSSAHTNEAVHQLLSALAAEKSRNVDLVRQNLTLQSSSSSLLTELDASAAYARRLKSELAQEEQRSEKYKQRAIGYRDRAHAAEAELQSLRVEAESRRLQVLAMFDSLRGQFIDVLTNWSEHISSLHESEQGKLQQLEAMRKNLQDHASQISQAKEQLAKIHETPRLGSVGGENETKQPSSSSSEPPFNPLQAQRIHRSPRETETEQLLRAARARLDAPFGGSVSARGSTSGSQYSALNHPSASAPHSTRSYSRSRSRSRSSSPSSSSYSGSCRSSRAYRSTSRSSHPSRAEQRVQFMRAQAEWEAGLDAREDGREREREIDRAVDESRRGRSRERSAAVNVSNTLSTPCCPHPHALCPSCTRAVPKERSNPRGVSFAPRSVSGGRSNSRASVTRARSVSRPRSQSRNRSASASCKARSNSLSRSRSRSKCGPRSYPEFLQRPHANYLHTRSSAGKIVQQGGGGGGCAGSGGNNVPPAVALTSSFPERPCSGAKGRDNPASYGMDAMLRDDISPRSGRAWTFGRNHTSVQTHSSVKPIYSYSSNRGDLLDSNLCSSLKKPASEGWRIPGLVPPTARGIAGRGESKQTEPVTPPQASQKAVFAKIATIPVAGIKTKY